MPEISETLLYELEKHLNNFFNPQNDPNNPQRNYPPAFLELAEEIDEYNKNNIKSGVSSETNFSHSYTLNLDFQSWKKAFARELSIYKRVKFI